MVTYAFDQAFQDTLVEFQKELEGASGLKGQKLLDFMHDLDAKRRERANERVKEHEEAEQARIKVIGERQDKLREAIKAEIIPMWNDHPEWSAELLAIAELEKVGGIRFIVDVLDQGEGEQRKVTLGTPVVIYGKGPGPRTSTGTSRRSKVEVTHNGSVATYPSWKAAYEAVVGPQSSPMNADSIRRALDNTGATYKNVE